MRKISFLCFLFSLLSLPQRLCFGALSAQLLFNDEEKTVMNAGEPTNLKLDIFNDESPEPLHHFHPMHEKPLHLLIISEDMESFSHLHPTQLSEHLGLFSVDLNQPTNDPYNLDSTKSVLQPGNYFVFAESMPMGYSMTTIPLKFIATGDVQPKKPLILDPIQKDGLIYKNFDDYKVKLKVRTYAHCGTFSASFEAEIQKYDPDTKAFAEVKDLEPWLSSFAHAVMLSENGLSANDKKFVHLHAVWPLVDDPETERGPYLKIASDSHVPMSEGVFKVWLQLQHHKQVKTFPFVVEIKAPPQNGKSLKFCL